MQLDAPIPADMDQRAVWGQFGQHMVRVDLVLPVGGGDLAELGEAADRNEIGSLEGVRWSRSFGQPPGWNKLRPVPGFWF